MVLLPKGLKALKKLAKKVGLDLRGASLNLDPGCWPADTAIFRRVSANASEAGLDRWGHA
jgi:hypothetical protein